MEIREFIKEYKRMCGYYYDTQCEKNGEDCPMKNRPCDSIECLTETAIDEVEIWSKTHPIETRQSQLLKIYPNAKMWDNEGFLSLCPKHLDTKKECSVPCGDCCREYWGEVVE